MSYILDALRRAEAQRARGAVPTLHAPALGPAPDGRVTAGPLRAWLVAAVVLLVVATGAALWYAWQARARAEQPPSGSVTVPAMPGPLPTPTGAAPVPAPMAPLPVAPEGPVANRPTLPQPPPVPGAARAGAPPRDPVPAAAGATRPVPVARQVAPDRAAPAMSPRPPVPASAAPPVGARPSAPPALLPPVARRELPADLQRELPALALNGTVYSPDPPQRMVLVNGEVWREGDRLGADLVVEEIRRHDAVLRYKGQRFILAP